MPVRRHETRRDETTQTYAALFGKAQDGLQGLSEPGPSGEVADDEVGVLLEVELGRGEAEVGRGRGQQLPVPGERHPAVLVLAGRLEDE
jgi:hypothetical protein